MADLDDLNDLNDLNDFADFVQAGLPLLESQDRNRWQLGDIAARFEVVLGRPHQDEQAPKLSDLASAWDVELPRLSEWRSVAAFYPPKVRTYELSWSHYNLARRHSNNNLGNALELLEVARTLYLGVRDFKRYLAGEIWEGRVPYEQQPPFVQAVNPERLTLWATFRKEKPDV